MLLTKLKHWLFARPYLIIALLLTQTDGYINPEALYKITIHWKRGVLGY